MRAVRCWCDELLVETTDEALVAALSGHVAEQHPDEERSEGEVRARVAAKAYEPPDRPPWAY